MEREDASRTQYAIESFRLLQAEYALPNSDIVDSGELFSYASRFCDALEKALETLTALAENSNSLADKMLAKINLNTIETIMEEKQ